MSTLNALALFFCAVGSAQTQEGPSGPLKIACTPVRVPPTNVVLPTYPSIAKKAGIEGKVVLRVLVGKDGLVKNIEIAFGHPFFNQASRDAILQWRYKLVLLNGKPVEFETTVTVIYELPRPKRKSISHRIGRIDL